MRHLPSRLLLCTTVSLHLAGNLVSADENQEAAAAPGALLWKHEFAGQIWGPLTHEPGVLYFGCDTGTVYAFDLDSRSIRWEFQSGGKVRSAVQAAAGKAVFASDDGYAYALESTTGKELWRFDLGGKATERILPAAGPPYEYDYLQSSPVVVGSTVYIGSVDGNLYALDHESGESRWKFPTQGKIRATPTVTNGTVYVGSWDGNLYAIDAESGELRWQFATGGIIQGSAAVGNGKVIVGSRSTKIFAVNAASGQVEWEYVHPDGSWVESSPVVRDGIIFIGSSDALKLFAFDLETGKELWAFKTNGWSWGTPVVTDELVYTGGISASPYYFPGVELEPGFYAVDRQTGEERWSVTPQKIEGYITGGVFSTPTRVGQVVFVAALDGHLYAIQD